MRSRGNWGNFGARGRRLLRAPPQSVSIVGNCYVYAASASFAAKTTASFLCLEKSTFCAQISIPKADFSMQVLIIDSFTSLSNGKLFVTARLPHRAIRTRNCGRPATTEYSHVALHVGTGSKLNDFDVFHVKNRAYARTLYQNTL